MAFEVLPIERPAHRETAQVLARSFADDPTIVSIFRGVSAAGRVKRLTDAFVAMLAGASKKGLVLGVWEDRHIAGAAIVHPPGAYPLPTVAQVAILARFVVRNGMGGVGRWLSLLSAYDKHHVKEPHYYLELIGVEPARQRRGIGSALLRHCVGRADGDRVGAYLESSNPVNDALYQRFGFGVSAAGPVVGVPISFMWRPVPQGALGTRGAG